MKMLSTNQKFFLSSVLCIIFGVFLALLIAPELHGSQRLNTIAGLLGGMSLCLLLLVMDAFKGTPVPKPVATDGSVRIGLVDHPYVSGMALEFGNTEHAELFPGRWTVTEVDKDSFVMRPYKTGDNATIDAATTGAADAPAEPVTPVTATAA
jgi:hypothetical protein